MLNILITLTIPSVKVSKCLENPAGTYPPNLAYTTLSAEATCGEKLSEPVAVIIAVHVKKTGKNLTAANDRLGPSANCASPLHPGGPVKSASVGADPACTDKTTEKPGRLTGLVHSTDAAGTDIGYYGCDATVEGPLDCTKDDCCLVTDASHEVKCSG